MLGIAGSVQVQAEAASAGSAPQGAVLTLLELALPEVAAHHRVAVLIDAIKVLAGHADHIAFPVLQVSFVDKVSLIHDFPAVLLF